MAEYNSNINTSEYPAGPAPRSQIYISWLIFASVLAGVVYLADKANNSIVLSTIFYFIIFGIHLVRIVRRDAKIDWLAPDFVFLVLYSLFYYGYITFYVLKIVPYNDYIFFFPNLMPFALFLVNFGALIFIIGYECGFSYRRDVPLIYAPKYSPIPHSIWSFIAWFLMIVAMIFQFGSLALVPRTALLRDTYYVIAHMGEYVRYPEFFNISDRIFLAGAAIYFAVNIYRSGKLFGSKLGMLVIFGVMMFSMLCGDRGPVAKLLIVILGACWYSVKRIKLKWLLLIVVISIFLVGAARILRHTAGLDISRIPSEYQYQKTRQELPMTVQTLAEFGGSVKVINGTVGFTRGFQYWWGRSLVEAFVGTITRRLTVGWGKTPAGWMTYEMYGPDMPGTGFSIVAEGYLNFGIPGVFLVMFGVGYILRRLYIRLTLMPGLINLVLLLVALSSAVFWIRQNAELAIPLFTRMWIGCYLIGSIFPSRYAIDDRYTSQLANVTEGDMYAPVGY